MDGDVLGPMFDIFVLDFYVLNNRLAPTIPSTALKRAMEFYLLTDLKWHRRTKMWRQGRSGETDEVWILLIMTPDPYD